MIIELNPKDYSKCRNIWDMSKNPARTGHWYRELLSGNRVIFVYVENGEYIGEASLVFDRDDPDYTIPGSRIYLSRMVVKKACRKRGVGTALLRHVVDYAKKKGYSEMSLGVDIRNTIAQRLYANEGFDTEIFRGSDENGEYVKLLKQL